MKKKKWLSAILLVLAAGLLVWHASLHRPTGPAEGVAIHGHAAESPTVGRTLRIGTFNIHGCKGRDGHRDPDRVAECLADLDFVALNEVHGPRLWHDTDQAEQLGRRLGVGWLFAPVARVWYHRTAGNGLLSRLPVTFWQRIPLPRKLDHSYRNAVLVGLEHQGRTVHVLLTHISRRHDAEREAQLRAVIGLYLSLAEPAILLGDLNSDAEDRQIRRLLNTPGVEDPVGRILGDKAPRRIDWIVTRGFRPLDAGLIDNGSSDHPLVWAQLEPAVSSDASTDRGTQ